MAKIRSGYESRAIKYDEQVLKLAVKQKGPKELIMRAELIKKLLQVLPGPKFKRTLKEIVKTVPYDLSLSAQEAKIHQILK